MVLLFIASYCSAQTPASGVFIQDETVVPFSATPSFDAGHANAFKITLTGNVTSSTLVNGKNGQSLDFEVCQDATGGRTFVPPTNLQGWVTISSAANACTDERFIVDGCPNSAPPRTCTNVLASLASFNALSPMTTLGDVTYESGANTASRLAGNTTTTKKYLSQTGTGTVSAAPSWQQIAAADLSDGNTGTGSIVHTTSPALASPTTTGTDSGTETLQNKSLAGASSGNSVTLLNYQGPASAIVGTGADATLYTYTLPANTLATGKAIRVSFGAVHSTGAASTQFKLKFGGTEVMNGMTGTGGASGVAAETFIANVGNTSTQKAWSNVRQIDATLLSPQGATAAIATTASVTILVTFNVAATDQVTPEMFMVELIQ